MRLPRYRCSLKNGILFKGQTTIHARKTIVPLPRKPHFAFKWSLGKFLPYASSQRSPVDFNELISFLENNYKTSAQNASCSEKVGKLKSV